MPGQPRRPFVELQVGRSVGYFLLDTGAGAHVMSDWFFKAAFPERPLRGLNGQAQDFAGVPLPTTVVSAVPVRWPDGRPQALDFAVGPFSRHADPDGLAGIVSPQALLGGFAGVELDFPARALRLWPRLEPLGYSYSLQDRTLQACPAGTHGATVFAWATAVDGEPLWAMMDTGSPVTALALEAPLGQRLWPTARPVEAGRGLSNAPVEARAVTAQVDFAGVSWRAQVAVMKLPLRECGTGALLGMNLLGHCSVTVARDRGWARCQP